MATRQVVFCNEGNECIIELFTRGCRNSLAKAGDTWTPVSSVLFTSMKGQGKDFIENEGKKAVYMYTLDSQRSWGTGKQLLVAKARNCPKAAKLPMLGKRPTKRNSSSISSGRLPQLLRPRSSDMSKLSTWLRHTLPLMAAWCGGPHRVCSMQRLWLCEAR